MRYEAGNCTIAISMKRPFKQVDFNVGHIFAKNSTQAKAIYNPWFFMILGQNLLECDFWQNVTVINNHFYDII